MGLRDYKAYKREQELKTSETILLLFDKIKALEEEIAKLKAGMSTPTKPRVFTKEEEEKMKKLADGKAKPEDFIQMFTSDLEEFDPNA